MSKQNKKVWAHLWQALVYGVSAAFCFVGTWRHGDPTNDEPFLPLWFYLLSLLVLYCIPFIFVIISVAHFTNGIGVWRDNRRHTKKEADARR